MTTGNRRDTIVRMRITIRDLHMKTGAWVRRAARGDSVVVTDRGRPAASLVPFCDSGPALPFSERPTLPEFDALPAVPGDAAAGISDDRDRG